MKTITYRGKQYEAPEWVRYVSTDANGTIVGHSDKPEINGRNSYWCSLGMRYMIKDHYVDWEDSLEEV